MDKFWIIVSGIGVSVICLLCYLFIPVTPENILKEYYTSFKQDVMIDSFFVNLSSNQLGFEDFSIEQHRNLDIIFVDNNTKVKKYIEADFEYYNSLLSRYEINRIHYNSSEKRFHILLQGATRYGITPSSIFIEVVVIPDSVVNYNFHNGFEIIFAYSSKLR